MLKVSVITDFTTAVLQKACSADIKGFDALKFKTDSVKKRYEDRYEEN